MSSRDCQLNCKSRIGGEATSQGHDYLNSHTFRRRDYLNEPLIYGSGGRAGSPRVRLGVDLRGRGRGRRRGVFPKTTLNFLDSLQTRPDPTRSRPRSEPNFHIISRDPTPYLRPRDPILKSAARRVGRFSYRMTHRVGRFSNYPCLTLIRLCRLILLKAPNSCRLDLIKSRSLHVQLHKEPEVN